MGVAKADICMTIIRARYIRDVGKDAPIGIGTVCGFRPEKGKADGIAGQGCSIMEMDVFLQCKMIEAPIIRKRPCPRQQRCDVT
ncbi:hypothetical protein AA103581_0089 [Gluconobacter wancherniae NBRC 103581]|nr:hypothetical protein AA103581_0089 [Gluconobacter wancherniae NBRC 103581]